MKISLEELERIIKAARAAISESRPAVETSAGAEYAYRIFYIEQFEELKAALDAVNIGA